jgi:hypothetical protein
MSWLFSQALVEEYLGDTCSDGEPSAPSSGNPTQLAYLSPDKMTVFSRLSRFGMTFKPLTADRGEELLTSYLEAFPARTSQPLGKGLGLTESGQECGEKWHASFVKYDQNSCLWKTHQCSLLGDLEPFSETWPQWGLMRGGECWEQQMSALRIRETASGLWPTPVKSDFAARRPSKGWKGTDLPSVVWTRSGGKENPNKPPVKLNPKWVSWLMGWPLEWTNLRRLEMDKFRLWQQQHGAS